MVHGDVRAHIDDANETSKQATKQQSSHPPYQPTQPSNQERQKLAWATAGDDRKSLESKNWQN